MSYYSYAELTYARDIWLGYYKLNRKEVDAYVAALQAKTCPVGYAENRKKVESLFLYTSIGTAKRQPGDQQHFWLCFDGIGISDPRKLTPELLLETIALEMHNRGDVDLKSMWNWDSGESELLQMVRLAGALGDNNTANLQAATRIYKTVVEMLNYLDKAYPGGFAIRSVERCAVPPHPLDDGYEARYGDYCWHLIIGRFINF